MFKYFKEMRELKKNKLNYEVFILGEISRLLIEFKDANENKTNIVELADKLKNVSEKDILEALVKDVKDKK